MRIGVIWDPGSAAGHYRAIAPAQAMGRRGHEIVWPDLGDGGGDRAALSRCDVVIVYRRYDAGTRRLVSGLVRDGVGVVYDNDDDYLAAVESFPEHELLQGVKGAERFGHTLEMATTAHVMTATTDPVAERYRGAGADPVVVIPNMLMPRALRQPRSHEGVVVGWVAALEHADDARTLGLRDALIELLRRHEDVGVHCLGVDLELPERYVHESFVPFADVGERIAGFDVGLAPLTDTPFNRARSDIKVKEYAACGVPWLASPVGPYRALGEREGGRLVADREWLDALDVLVRKRRQRRKLASRAQSWARGQTVEATADRWEDVLYEAAERAGRAAVV